MSVKAVTLLQFNGLEWNLRYLSEESVLMESKKAPLESIQESARYIRESLKNELVDIVQSYDSIALFTHLSLEEISFLLRYRGMKVLDKKKSVPKVEIPICYELGLDLDEVAQHSHLSKEEVINQHLNGKYQVALIGFTPGFLYLSGLPPELSCPRKIKPRLKMEQGSVGIGGSQTGIYSLPSPGGWNIIGRTPLPLFVQERVPPMSIDAGTHLTFKRISVSAFNSWEG